MKFRNQFAFLSNMFPCLVTIPVNGAEYTFPCAESAFQAMKCMNRMKDFTCGGTYRTGYEAKRAGRNVPLRSDWKEVRIPLMRMIVTAKFEQHPELMKQLKAISGPITEDNTWGDTFWGVCGEHGKNWLGRILMEIRDGVSPS